MKIAGSNDVSRRHCVIINCRDDVWLYDLDSTGTWVNGERVQGKVPLIGRVVVQIASREFSVTADKDSLI